MRVLVCGGRDFSDWNLLCRVMLTVEDERPTIIHGAARGADSLAGKWAAERGFSVEAYPADWQTHGKAAGHIRNARMLREGRPDLVIAFPGGRGTANMVEQSVKAGVQVIRVSADQTLRSSP